MHKILRNCLTVTLLLVATYAAEGATSKNAARVTRVIRDVKLLPPKAEAKPATVNDNVRDDTAVRTGQESRSELTFVDLRITRLGENTIFTFNKAGHNVQLNSGSILLYVPKDSGGGQMATAGVSVAITGTTVTFQSKRGRSQLTVFEGGARASLIKYPKESVYVRAGQMIDVPAGATKMPQPVNINLKDAMKSPLITDFPPLPSAGLIGTSAPPPPGNSDPWANYPTHTRPFAPSFPPKNPPSRGGGTTVGTQPTNPVSPPTKGGGTTVGTQPTNPGGEGTGTGGNTGGGKVPPGKKPPFGTVKTPPTAGTSQGGSTPAPNPIYRTTGPPAGGTSTTSTTTGSNQSVPRKIGRGRQATVNNPAPTPDPRKKRLKKKR